jgi:hypothetical protein
MYSSGSPDGTTRLLLICGALAGPLFTIAWFVEGRIHPDYDAMRHAISSLAVGKYGEAQVANFLFTGILTLALAIGLQSAMAGVSIWAVILMGIFGIGFLGAGLFITDPLNGYPPGTAPLPVPPSLSGSLHLFFSALAFGLPAACFVLTPYFAKQGKDKWALYSKITALAFIITYAVALAGFLQVDALINYAGLWQRISLTIGLTWMTFLAVHLMEQISQKHTKK